MNPPFLARNRILSLSVAAATALGSLPCLAQPAKPVARGAAAGQGQANAKAPLDNLDERRLMAEVATRKLNCLLDNLFQKDNMPGDQRQQILWVEADGG